MSKIKVNEIDSRSGTDITVTTGKTLTVPAGATLDVSAGAITGPLPAVSATNLTNIPGANITGDIPAAALGNVDFGPTEDDIAVLGFQVAAASDLAQYNPVSYTHLTLPTILLV